MHAPQQSSSHPWVHVQAGRKWSESASDDNGSLDRSEPKPAASPGGSDAEVPTGFGSSADLTPLSRVDVEDDVESSDEGALHLIVPLQKLHRQHCFQCPLWHACGVRNPVLHIHICDFAALLLLLLCVALMQQATSICDMYDWHDCLQLAAA